MAPRPARRLAVAAHRRGVPGLSPAARPLPRGWRLSVHEPARYRGVHAFYAWLRREGEITENPVDRIIPPRVPLTVQPHYTTDDVSAVLKSLRGRRTKGVDAARTRTIILLLFDTDLRASELCGLRTYYANSIPDGAPRERWTRARF